MGISSGFNYNAKGTGKYSGNGATNFNAKNRDSNFDTNRPVLNPYESDLNNYEIDDNHDNIELKSNANEADNGILPIVDVVTGFTNEFNNDSKNDSFSNKSVWSLIGDAVDNIHKENDKNYPDVFDLTTWAPLQDNIFNSETAEKYRFGGYQGCFIENSEIFIRDSQAKRIIRSYYGSTSSEDRELLFYRMNRCGCGYVACINAIMQRFQNRDKKFEKTFGFPLKNEDGEYNYEYLFLDFFLFWASEYEGYETIEEVYGNAAEERELFSGDSALDHSNFERIGMDGTFGYERQAVIKKYLNSKGIDYEYVFDYDDYRDLKNRDVDNPSFLDEALYLQAELKTADNQSLLTPARIDKVCDDPYAFIIISARDFSLYHAEDVDGNGKFDDVCYEDLGAHAMYVVGMSPDRTKVIVSSWGKIFLIDIDEIYSYDIGVFNPY